MPTEGILSFKSEWGIGGLWVGYGASALLLTMLYYALLIHIDWRATAEWAAQSDDFSVSSGSSSSNASSEVGDDAGVSKDEGTAIDASFGSLTSLVELDKDLMTRPSLYVSADAET